MLSIGQMNDMGMMESAHAKKSRVVTTNYCVLKIKEECIKDDEKLKDLYEGVKKYATASREAKGAINKQSGIHIDKSNGTGEVYFFSLYASPSAMDSHVANCFDAYCNQILPYATMDQTIATTGEEDMEFWTDSLSGWTQAPKFDVLENVNDPEKKPYADPTLAAVDELIEMGLSVDVAKECVDAMTEAAYQGDFPPSEHRCVMEVVFQIKPEVVSDDDGGREERIAKLKQLMKDYGDCSRTTTGKLACEIALSEKFDQIYVLEHFNSRKAHLAHTGRCMKIALKLFEYVTFDEYVVSCAKEDIEYFTENGNRWKPTTKMVVMEWM